MEPITEDEQAEEAIRQVTEYLKGKVGNFKVRNKDRFDAKVREWCEDLLEAAQVDVRYGCLLCGS